MYPSVRSHASSFNAKLEGQIPYMYLDVKGLVTTGIGNLIDPIDSALDLPFKYLPKAGPALSGKPASKDDITREWHMIKQHKELAAAGARSHKKKDGTIIHGADTYATMALDDAGISALFDKSLDKMNAALAAAFHDFERWPADAQLGLLSMAWAQGPNFHKWPHFRDACLQQDFASAAEQSHISNANADRNNANLQLFLNASVVAADNTSYNRAILYYPQALVPLPGVSKPPTAGAKPKTAKPAAAAKPVSSW
jgi:hypothetical protein